MGFFTNPDDYNTLKNRTAKSVSAKQLAETAAGGGNRTEQEKAWKTLKSKYGESKAKKLVREAWRHAEGGDDERFQKKAPGFLKSWLNNHL